LGNQIYEYTFFAEAQTSLSGLAPHALTRVIQQVRRESLGLYYSSVETLEIPLYDEKNVAHVGEWLAESSLQHYPVLPDIAFATTANFRDDSEPVLNTVRPLFHFKQQTVNAAEELECEASSRVSTRDELTWTMLLTWLLMSVALGYRASPEKRIATTPSSAGTVNASLMPSTTAKPGPVATSTYWLQNSLGVPSVWSVCGFRSLPAAMRAVLIGEKPR
jgi:hypothetical protein